MSMRQGARLVVHIEVGRIDINTALKAAFRGDGNTPSEGTESFRCFGG